MASEKGWEEVLSSHRAAWDTIWEDADIEIPGEQNTEPQLVARASLFHILSNVYILSLFAISASADLFRMQVRDGSEATGLGGNSIAPSGLTSDSYAGQIFVRRLVFRFPCRC